MSKNKTLSLSYPADDEDFIAFLNKQHNVSASIRLICSTWFAQHKDEPDYAQYLTKMGQKAILATQQQQPESTQTKTVQHANQASSDNELKSAINLDSNKDSFF